MSVAEMTSAPNIGPRLAAGLHSVGVDTMDQLCNEGAIATWERLRHVDAFDCVHSLLALEGAIRGIRWHQLPPRVRTELADYVHRRPT